MSRIFAISDTHSEYKQNREFIENISNEKYLKDTLILAGDVNARFDSLRQDLTLLLGKFSRVFYVPGNHDLWVGKTDGLDSIEKFQRILVLCQEIGVETNPSMVGDVMVVPLFSWYSSDFVDSTSDSFVEKLEGWSDDYFCSWPASVRPSAVPDHFAELNEGTIESLASLKGETPIISFSHFVPRRELLPVTQWMRHPGLLHVMGCQRLERQVRRLGSRIHVFGHSHIHIDKTIDGTRYVQNALRYPKEREFYRISPKLLEIWRCSGSIKSR